MRINIVKDFLNSQAWQYTQVKDSNILIFGIKGRNAKFQCIADFQEEDKRFFFFSVCGANTPSENRSEMLDLLNFLNFDLFFGNFEMNPENGEVRFRTSISLNHIELNADFLEEIIMSNIITMDNNLPSILGVMFGQINTEKAIELYHQEK